MANGKSISKNAATPRPPGPGPPKLPQPEDWEKFEVMALMPEFVELLDEQFTTPGVHVVGFAPVLIKAS